MAHKKGGGSTKNGRDSNPQFLGVKRFDGQWVLPGQVVVRQRGATFKPSPSHTYQGRDFTLHSKKAGFISFKARGVQVGRGGSFSDALMCKLANLWVMAETS